MYKWHYHKEIHNTSEITHKITQKVVHTRQNIRCWSHFSVGSYTKLPYCNVGSLKFWQSYVLFFPIHFECIQVFRLNTISKFGLYYRKRNLLIENVIFIWEKTFFFGNTLSVLDLIRHIIWVAILVEKKKNCSYILCKGLDIHNSIGIV